MKRPQRKAALKWTVLGLFTLIFMAWFASARGALQVSYVHGATRSDFFVSWSMVEAGRMDYSVLGLTTTHLPQGWNIGLAANRHERQWAPHWESSRWGDVIQIPLYIPLLLLAAPVAWLACTRRRRARAGLCTRCGYDRAGLEPGTPCPECGRGSAA